MKLLGLSLSFCICDIAQDKVNIEDVHHIITACSPENEAQVQGVLDVYCKMVWKRFPAEAIRIFTHLRGEGKIQWIQHWEKRPVRGGLIWLPYPDEHIDFKTIRALYPTINRI